MCLQYQSLYESSQQYEPGTQYIEYIRHLTLSSQPSRDQFVFEKYTGERYTAQIQINTIPKSVK